MDFASRASTTFVLAALLLTTAASAQTTGNTSEEAAETVEAKEAVEEAKETEETAEEAEAEEAVETAEAAPQSVDVTYSNGEIALAAELLLPAAGDEPAPGAVIVQGSGSSDRGNNWSRSIALELVRGGLAVMLTDKRGSGQSKGDWRRAGFGELAGDALAAVRFLTTRPEVDGERIGLVGLSQGGRVAPILAAVQPGEIAFIVNLSGSAVSFAEQSFFEMANTARDAGLDAAGVDEVIEVNRLAGRFLVNGDWKAYAEARSAGLEGEAASVAQGFPAERDDPIWTFLRRVWDFDPLPYWTLIEQPALIVYGGGDDNAPVAESVRRLKFAFAAVGNDEARILVIDDAGHGLRDPATGDLHPRLTSILAAWLAEHVGS